jgi:hypothetical protein
MSRQYQGASSRILINVFRFQFVFLTKYIYLTTGYSWGYQGGEYKKFCLLGYYAVESGKIYRPFGVHAPPIIWADIGDQQISPKCSCIFTRQHDDTTRHYSEKHWFRGTLIFKHWRKVNYYVASRAKKINHIFLFQNSMWPNVVEKTQIRCWWKPWQMSQAILNFVPN